MLESIAKRETGKYDLVALENSYKEVEIVGKGLQEGRLKSLQVVDVFKQKTQQSVKNTSQKGLVK